RDIRYALRNVIDFLVAHPGIDGERDDAFVEPFGPGEVAGGVSEFAPVERVHVERYEVNARSYPETAELFDEPRAVYCVGVGIDEEGEEVVRRFAPGDERGRREAGGARDRVRVPPRYLFPPRGHAVELRQLR